MNVKFYNRETEIKILEEIEKYNGKRMISISGRRRVGKTRLITEFINGKKAIYFFVERKSEEMLLKSFSEELRALLPEIAIGTLRWEDIFSTIFEHMDIVVFDEFQNFQSVNPGIYSTFHKIWDSRDWDVMVLLLGSYMGMMRRLFEDYRSPLYGRTVGRIVLSPLDFENSVKIMKDLGFSHMEDMMKVYAMIGGIPKYYEFIELYGVRRWEDSVKRLFSSGLKPLVDEPEIILAGEFGRERRTYMSILNAVADGKATMMEISHYTGISPGTMGKYLQELVEYHGILERRVPVMEKKSSKRGRYFLKDRLMAFWLRYLRPNMFLIETGNEKEFLKRLKGTYNDFTARVFEDIVRELLIKKRIFEADNIGSWWNRRGDEIDILALNEYRKEILFGEIKWRNRATGWNVVEELIKKKELVHWRNEDRKERFLIVSKSGFTKKCLESMESEGIMHWDLKDIERMMER